MGLCVILGWYQAGRMDLRWGDRRIAMKVSLYFWAVLIILIMSLFRFFACAPLMDGFHVCMKALILALGFVFFGAAALIAMSVSFAQAGRLGERFK